MGFVVVLIYVILNSPDLDVARVRHRVANGGHDVPAEKIVDRYARSLAQLPWFLEHADRAYIYDNSTTEPIEVGVKVGNSLRLSLAAEHPLVKAMGLA